MNKIFVTQPSVPPLEEFIPYLEKIWSNKILTNNGEFHQLFEKELSNFLGVKHISLFSNGTLALMVAIQALELKGEVITTPFTFAATGTSLLWSKITPVFCDIKMEDGNIDENKIEKLITSKTTAILPVHVYGNPCNTLKLSEIAIKNKLKIIYDAAHAFNVKVNHDSILNHGDLSIISFHATKIFNTFEGGAIISHSLEMKQKIDQLKNFGFQNENSIISAGINAKMNEFQASMGVLQLKYINEYIEKSKSIHHRYIKGISNSKGISFFKLKDNITYNYSYFPIIVNDDFRLSRDELFDLFISNNIFVRKYFYPLISDFEVFNEFSNKKEFPIASAISSKILCLPIYPDLQNETIDVIINIINE